MLQTFDTTIITIICLHTSSASYFTGEVDEQAIWLVQKNLTVHMFYKKFKSPSLEAQRLAEYSMHIIEKQ
jgi:hypothetical protein